MVYGVVKDDGCVTVRYVYVKICECIVKFGKLHISKELL